jgi:hypothetical protein
LECEIANGTGIAPAELQSEILRGPRSEALDCGDGRDEPVETQAAVEAKFVRYDCLCE